MHSSPTTTLGSVLAAGALLLAACGDSDDEPVSAGATTPATVAETAPTGSTTADSSPPSSATPVTGNDAGVPEASDLPQVDVIDVRTGATVDLTSLAPRDKPMLLWFYAPH